MGTRQIHDDRISKLNDQQRRDGDYVLYWMQQSQRAQCNHALEYAVRRANDSDVPLLVAFAVMDDYPDATARHYQFMLAGLQEVRAALERRSIPFIIRRGDPPQVIAKLAGDACEVVCDRGYLRHQRDWRDQVANAASCPVWQVEADAVVPVEIASDHQEYAARTIRSQLNDRVAEYSDELLTTPLKQGRRTPPVEGIDISDLTSLIRKLGVEGSIESSPEFEGGTKEARRRLDTFLSESLNRYDERTSVVDPQVSMLSPYLHFGQISPVQIVNAVKSKRGVKTDAKSAYLEELIVRRELAINFVHYQSDYDSLDCLPDWARETLAQHEDDEREYHYSSTELEAAETHDAAWNAAMLEMKHRGYLHNHLRMYWGKKIIEWTNTTAHAYRTALELNNRYFFDGRDANSYANVAWLFGLHDRAHQERDIFGKVRYMSAGGLDRKIDVDEYIESVERRYDVEVQRGD